MGLTLYGNRIEVLPGGRGAYEAMLRSITMARRSLAIEMYTWQDDRIGRRFAEAVCAKLREGIPVFVVLDAFGSFTTGRLAAWLQQAGARLLWYHPLAPWTPSWYPNRRDHRKLILVDGSAGFAGGMNLAEEYTEEFAGGRAWRDLSVRVEGPAVREMTRLFLSSWVRAGGTTHETAPLIVSPAEAGSAGVEVMGGQGIRSRRRLQRFYLAQIALARKSIFLANGYFLPEGPLRRALRRAARRGVRVELLLAGQTDAPLVRWAGRASYERLLAAGVRVREMGYAMLHAKIAVFDEEVLLTGSANLDHRSFRHNLEVAVNVRDTAAAGAALSAFLPEFDRSREVRLDDWRKRPLPEKLLERFAGLFRYWL